MAGCEPADTKQVEDLESAYRRRWLADAPTAEELIAELFRRGLARQMESRTIVDGVNARRAADPGAVRRLAQAKAVSGLTTMLISDEVVSVTEEDLGPDFSPGSTVHKAVIVVLT